MTIEQRQRAAEVWANAWVDWRAADEQAAHYDRLRADAWARVEVARKELTEVAAVGGGLPESRTFMLNRSRNQYRLVKVTYLNPLNVRVELLLTEPNE